jgi:hypothetical protein
MQFDDKAVGVTQANTLAQVTFGDAAVGDADVIKIGDPLAQVFH